MPATNNSAVSQQARNPNNHAKRSMQLTQAIDIQRRLAEACLSLKTENKDLASLARSWVAVTDQLRVLRGIPDPGQLRPESSVEEVYKSIKRLRSKKFQQLPSFGMLPGACVEVEEAEPGEDAPEASAAPATGPEQTGQSQGPATGQG